MSATRASPDFSTSKPSPFSPFLDGSSNCERYLANFAFSVPKWYSVAVERMRKKWKKKRETERKIRINKALKFENLTNSMADRLTQALFVQIVYRLHKSSLEMCVMPIYLYFSVFVQFPFRSRRFSPKYPWLLLLVLSLEINETI